MVSTWNAYPKADIEARSSSSSTYAAQHLEAPGEVLNVDPEHRPCVGAASAADQPPKRAPFLHAPTGHVSGAEHEVGAGRAGEQARQVGGIVGEVRVHLDDEICAARQRLAKPCDVGGAETLLARPVKHRDVLMRRREPLGDLPGTVGRGVIDDEDAPWLA